MQEWCGVCNIIIERKSYNFENPKTTFIINRNLSCNSKNVVYIIECNKCEKVYIGSTQVLNTSVSIHKSNIQLSENRKLNSSKHRNECSNEMFKTMPIYQTVENILLQIKENFIENQAYTEENLNYVHTQRQIHTHTHTHTEKGRKQWPTVDKNKLYGISNIKNWWGE